MPPKIGVARGTITPPWGVELAGLGYYLGRTWTRIRDDLNVTALVAEDGSSAAAIIAIDVMFRPDYGHPETCREPGRALAGRALEALARSQPMEDDTVSAASRYRRQQVSAQRFHASPGVFIQSCPSARKVRRRRSASQN